MTPPLTRLGALTAACALLLTGCSSSEDSAAGGEPAVAAPEPGVVVAEQGSGSSGDIASDARAAADLLADPTATRSIVRTGQITVEVDQLATSAARVRQVALDARGFVASETTGFRQPVDPIPLAEGEASPSRSAGAGESVIVIRVPEARFAATFDAIAAIGTELSRSSTAEDVTAGVADLTSRTATARASVDRIRALLAEAKDLKDVVLLESELTRREADLEAYQARLAALTGQAEMSTITAVLRTPQAAANEPNALLRGLRQGWDAVQASTTMLLVLIGALLPFALVAALVLVPLWMLLRRRRRPAPATTSAAMPPPAAGPPTPGDPDQAPSGPSPVPAGSGSATD